MYFYLNTFFTKITYRRKEFSAIYIFVKFYCKSWRIFAFYFWYEYYRAFNVVSDCTEFQKYFSQMIRRRSLCFTYEAFVSLTLPSEACHTLKISQSFIVRRSQKNAENYDFRNFKTTFFQKNCTCVSKKFVIFGLRTCVLNETVFKPPVKFF